MLFPKRGIGERQRVDEGRKNVVATSVSEWKEPSKKANPFAGARSYQPIAWALPLPHWRPYFLGRNSVVATFEISMGVGRIFRLTSVSTWLARRPGESCPMSSPCRGFPRTNE